MRYRLHHSRRDEGTVLPLVLVCTVVIGMVVLAVANYTTTGLRYGHAVEARADRLAAADGGLRYAIQKLKKVGHHECPTINPPDVDGAVVTLTCTPVGDTFDDTEGYALILTGEGLSATAPLMDAQSAAGTPKRISGLVYMNHLDFSVQAPVQFENGQMQYTVPTSGNPSSDPCPTSHPVRDDGAVVDTADPGAYVRFADDHFGVVCTTQPWYRSATVNATDDPSTAYINERGKFAEPLIPAADLAALPLNPAPSAYGTCRVFLPGRYTVAPDLGAYNYFRSGNYVFAGITLEIRNEKVTAGRVLEGNGSTQAIPNTSCDGARNADNISNVTQAGATFYMEDGARVVVDANGSFEVVRRKQGKTYVSIHVLDNSLGAGDDVLYQSPGGNKDMAMHGLVWAPYARITLDEVANEAEAQLLGGAVISNIKVDSAAGTTGLVIAVEPGDITGKLQLDSTATTADGRSTTIRSIVDYRPSTKYAAATSWRVL